MLSASDYSIPSPGDIRNTIFLLAHNHQTPVPPDGNGGGGTPTWSLLVTVFTSILEVFILCFAGWILARKGILDKRTQKQLNRLNVSLFTPSLLFSKVAFALSPQKLKELWIIPLLFIGVTLTSALVAWIFGHLFRLKRTQRNFAMAAAMFNNSNSLPIALMQSLVITVKGLKWTADDTKDAMLGRALTYLVLYSTLGMMLRWSLGVHLLSQADDTVVPDEEPEPEVEAFRRTRPPPLVFSDPQGVTYGSAGAVVQSPTTSNSPVSSTTSPVITPQTLVAPPPAPIRRPTTQRQQSRVFYSFPNTPTRSHVDVAGLASSTDVDGDSDDEWGPVPRTPGGTVIPTSSRFQSIMRRTKKTICAFWDGFNEFMTVPMWAAIASLVVACIRPVQHALDAHMQPVKGSLAAAGNCSIPVTLIVLGAYFYVPKEERPLNADPILPNVRPDDEEEQYGHGSRGGEWASGSTSVATLTESLKKAFKLSSAKVKTTLSGQQATPGATSRPGEAKTVIVAILSRMIITPALLLPFVAGLAFFDLHRIFDDPVFVVSVVLLISSPPALTLAQITQAASGDAFERLISQTIFWSYCVFTPPLTILYVVIGLSFSRL